MVSEENWYIASTPDHCDLALPSLNTEAGVNELVRLKRCSWSWCTATVFVGAVNDLGKHTSHHRGPGLGDLIDTRMVKVLHCSGRRWHSGARWDREVDVIRDMRGRGVDLIVDGRRDQRWILEAYTAQASRNTFVIIQSNLCLHSSLLHQGLLSSSLTVRRVDVIMSTSKALSPYVTLVSSDGFEFHIRRSAACVSGTIRRMLDTQSRSSFKLIDRADSHRQFQWSSKRYLSFRKLEWDHPWESCRIFLLQWEE